MVLYLSFSSSLSPHLQFSTSPSPVLYLPFSSSLPPLLQFSTSSFPVLYLPFSSSLPPLLQFSTSPSPVLYLPFSSSLPPLQLATCTSVQTTTRVSPLCTPAASSTLHSILDIYQACQDSAQSVDKSQQSIMPREHMPQEPLIQEPLTQEPLPEKPLLEEPHSQDYIVDPEEKSSISADQPDSSPQFNPKTIKQRCFKVEGGGGEGNLLTVWHFSL
jgi:hypothetical protein